MKKLHKYSIAILLFFLFIASVQGQRNRRKEYNFKESTALSPVDAKYQNEDAVELKNVKIFEYKGIGAATLQRTVYKLIRINTDIGLEDYNKVAIPMYGVKSLLDLQVRFISPSGKVTLLDKSDLFLLDNLEGYGDFKVFAIKGAEIGGEIEYKYTVNMWGARSHLEIYYNDYPIQEATFELVAPSGRTIFIKPYNGFPDLVVDSDGRQAWYAHMEDVEPFEEEPFASNTSNRMKVAYSIQNIGTSPAEKWKENARGIYGYYINFPRREQKAALALYESFPLSEDSVEQKIEYIRKFCLEDIKVDINIYDNSISAISKSRKVSRTGVKMRLQAALFQAAGIKFEIAMTCDKYFTHFSVDYPFSYMVEKYFYYFPDIDLYLDPANRFFPLGIIPYKYVDENGFFVNFQSKNRYDFINAVAIDRAHNHFEYQISFDTNYLVHIESKKSYSAYDAAYYRTYLAYMDRKERPEYIEDIGKGEIEEFEVYSTEVENDSLNWEIYPPLPFMIKSQLHSGIMVEKADQDLILNIGLLINSSMDFYSDEKERKQDLMLTHPSQETYEIILNIPEDYRAVNLEDLEESIEYRNKKDEVCAYLKTSYEVKEQVLVYHIKSYYTKSLFPVEEYEEVKKVVNQIADLQFKSLILQPK